MKRIRKKSSDVILFFIIFHFIFYNEIVILFFVRTSIDIVSDDSTRPDYPTAINPPEFYFISKDFLHKPNSVITTYNNHTHGSGLNVFKVSLKKIKYR